MIAVLKTICDVFFSEFLLPQFRTAYLEWIAVNKQFMLASQIWWRISDTNMKLSIGYNCKKRLTDPRWHKIAESIIQSLFCDNFTKPIANKQMLGMSEFKVSKLQGRHRP